MFYKIMKKIFPILLLMTLISFLGVPDVVDVPTITFLGKTITEIQCSSILTVLDMLLFFYFDAHSKWEQNRNMQLGFKAINELPNYTEYIEYEQPNGAFQYELKNNQNDHNSSLPNKKNRVDCESFYGQKIPISKNAEACVAVPMLMSIKSKSNAVKLRISNIELYELENSAYVKLSLSKQQLQLNTPINDESNHLIRFDLLCTREQEEELFNKKIYIKFKVTLFRNDTTRISKYLILELQAVQGEFTVLSTFVMNSWFEYIYRFAKIFYVGFFKRKVSQFSLRTLIEKVVSKYNAHIKI